MKHGERGGDEREGGYDDLVAKADPDGLKRQADRRRTRGHADAVVGAAVRRELLLEREDFIAQDEAGTADCSFVCSLQIGSKYRVLAVESHERNGRLGQGFTASRHTANSWS